ncbi:glycosyltransferase family protein [Chitinophaga agri]|uniref:Mannosyltransferase n=1 Tax=Chitinophaga agri TaxID=2703787 RepID=A0A6B9ZGS5_9BACT|nr:hypothetical protein [Chitinophaga agri]QHS61266.1 hypothetical protein GWR21_17175 [Chitinophaga agri]
MKYFHYSIFSLAFVIYIITAFNSTGNYHFDEHYQILEFAGLKLGFNEVSDLPWEYNAQIRPTLQPAFCVLLFSVLNSFHLSDPYIQVLCLRIMMAIGYLVTICIFIQSTLSLVDKKFRHAYIFLSYFLWFLPFLNVRFSSESSSGLLFLLATGLLLGRRYPHLLIGFILGLSFICRFQSAFLIIGILAWYLIIQKAKKSDMFSLVAGCILAIGLGVLIDHWYYGYWLFTPVNYFYMNIYKGIASEFGRAPWYFYIIEILMAPNIIIGVILLLSLILLMYYKPQSFLIWVILPFLIAHSVIAHKEDRFLFPLINFIPLLLVLAWQESGIRFNKIYYALAGILLFINFTALIVMSFHPMDAGAKNITQYIHRHYHDQEVKMVFSTYTNPYKRLYAIHLRENFYMDNNVEEVYIKDKILLNGKVLLVLEKDEEDDPDNQRIINKYHLKRITQGMPDWVYKVSHYYNFKSPSMLILYGND